ncbi:hypothetical protein SAMN05216412_11363 [Nitrosospira multiformis]|uniref:DUF3467 domain-containing protein n=1 Tax=Nitrosospira multiformis TaxID=1231 RepID=A0A1I0GHB5_9PROT|nr:DUF3467 domain-containing protein [Nitrosospira multiformis]SET70529.1 hypothetical protein SAMN05216412_11363 [Nitrosospira multiformis]
MNNDSSDVVSPPNFSANNFIMVTGSRELGLILGQSRHIFDSKTGNHVGQIKDWHASYSISPVTAKQLLKALDDAIKNYEDNFGAIQEDKLERKKSQESGETEAV